MSDSDTHTSLPPCTSHQKPRCRSRAQQDVHAGARSVREQRRSVTVLLAGTSGTGKSTLAGLLAARLGITTVVSTDSVRHMLRSFADARDDPLLWASTYQVPHPACCSFLVGRGPSWAFSYNLVWSVSYRAFTCYLPGSKPRARDIPQAKSCSSDWFSTDAAFCWKVRSDVVERRGLGARRGST